VPVTAFSEFGQVANGDGKKPLHWFDVSSRAVFAFAGIWRPTERGNAYGFLTTEPNTMVAPIQSKAMPIILHDDDYGRWLAASWDEVPRSDLDPAHPRHHATGTGGELWPGDADEAVWAAS